MKRENILQLLKDSVHEVMPAGTRVVLFGSQARGDAREDSDWDILVLLNKDKLSPSDFDIYAYPVVEKGWQLGEYFSMKLYTKSDWQKRKGTPFFKNVETEGIEL